MQEQLTIQILCDEWDEYELLDSGYRQKLERFGPYIVIREETKAWWQPTYRNTSGNRPWPSIPAMKKSAGKPIKRFLRNG